MPSTDKRRVIAFLVHGTFAREADWVEEGSKIRTSLKDQLAAKDVDIQFEPIKWTGKNRFGDRHSAASIFLERYDFRMLTHPDSTFVAIGHSHGGSVIAYAVQAREALRDALSIAFLATPFVDLKIREASYAILTPIVTLLCYALFTGGLWFGWPLVERLFDQWAKENLSLGWIYFLSILLWGAGVYFVGRKALGWLKKIVESGCRTSARRFSTANINSERHVFVRCVGDEAAAALSAGQILQWVAVRAIGSAATFATKLDGVLAFGRNLVRGRLEAVWWTFLVLALAVGCIAAIVYSADEVLVVQSEVTAVAGFLNQIARQAMTIVEQVMGKQFHLFGTSEETLLLMALIWLLLMVVLLIGATMIAVYSIAALVFGLFSILLVAVSKSYGGLPLWQTPFLDIAVEPTPVGGAELLQIDWDQVEVARLNHSATYENSNVHSYLVKWLEGVANYGPRLEADGTVQV